MDGGIVGVATRGHEHTLNVWLSDLLRQRGLNARQEKMQGGRRIDVEVRIGPVRIALEAEQGQTNAKKREAIGDADKRLKQGLAECAIAVCYPEGITEPEQIPHSRMLWTIRAPNSLVPPHEARWSGANLDELASIIRLAPVQLGNPDHAAAALSASLDAAVERLDDAQKWMLAEELDLPQSTRRRRHWDKAAKRCLLVVATAVMFHARLDAHLAALRPEHDARKPPFTRFTDEWPPDTARQCTDADDPTTAFSHAWNLILALDYKPIFGTARAAINACPADPAFTGAIRETARAALEVAGNIAGIRHDLLGRIFHTVLDTARYDGSFYTTTAAATLLASLSITRGMCDWNDADAVANLRIVDPACGTGTLLMASAERIRQLSPQTRDDDRSARALIERVLSGYDVNIAATHMAATTLGLLSPTTRFRNMKIGRALLGVDDEGEAFLGSLDILDGKAKMLSWPNGGLAAQSKMLSRPSGVQIDSGEDMTEIEPADLVIMNPPFTRDSLRYDQFSRKDELKLKDREKQLFANTPLHLSAIGNAFLLLADYINKPDSSTVASVMPLVMATNESGLEIRKYLANRYYIDTIVTSHDPQRIYFSENTSIGEMLLVCRRWADPKRQKPPTRVVNLAFNPPTPTDAASVAQAIEKGDVEAQNSGTVQMWPADRIEAGNWGAVQFFSPYLCERFSEMVKGELFASVRLGSIAEVGPAGQRIREAYKKTGMPDAHGRMALWEHDTTVMQTMSVEPDTRISAKTEYVHRADRYWAQRSRLMLPTHLHLPTDRVTTVRSSTPVVGSAWVPCRVNAPPDRREKMDKALCVFLNSSVGILSMLGDRTNKKPTYPNLSIEDLRKLRIPDFAAMGDGAVWRMAMDYDSIAKRPLLPLPQMDSCAVRRTLDESVCAALRIDRETIDMIRRSLASEPSVTGRRYVPA